MSDSPSEWLDVAAARRFFQRAARTDTVPDVVAREVERRMAERLDLMRMNPARVLDAGCGRGEARGVIARHYPRSEVIGVDLNNEAMQRADKDGFGQRLRTRLNDLLPGRVFRHGARGASHFVCGDFSALPIAGGSFGLVWSNLALAWASDPLRAFGEFHRVLEPAGLLMFSTYGPDTLKELRTAFSGIDDIPHTHRFIDMHDLGDMLGAAGFVTPVMDMEVLTLTYPDLISLARDLRSSGQLNACMERRRTMTGRQRWHRMQSAYDAARVDGRLPATVEIVYGHAWRGEPRKTRDGHSIVQLEFESRRKIKRN